MARPFPSDSETAPSAVCWSCRHRFAARLFCPACDRLQPLPDPVGHFEVLEWPRRLQLDNEQLRERFYSLSRRIHPDRYQGAGAPELDFSNAASAAVNVAFRTLRDPLARATYWLTLQPCENASPRSAVPERLADLLFRAQDEMRAPRNDQVAAAALRAEAEQVERDLRGRLETLFELCDRSPSAGTAELRDVVHQLTYLRRLGDQWDAAAPDQP